jgi:hypothetical protein
VEWRRHGGVPFTCNLDRGKVSRFPFVGDIGGSFCDGRLRAGGNPSGRANRQRRAKRRIDPGFLRHMESPRTLCAYLLLREKVIKPLLAGVARPCRRPPKVSAPLDHHYETIGLAAA